MSTLIAAALAVVTFAQAHEPAPLPKGTNVVVGRVVDSSSGAPVPGAVVTLVGYFEPSGQPAAALPQSSDSPLATAGKHVLATADGSFVFRDLPAARYSLAAAAFGYAPNAYPLHVIEVADSSRPLNVALRLSKYASISGVVVDERGEPVTGVPVTALRRSVVSGGLALHDSSPPVETDDRGEYRIAQLAPGNYVVGVLATSTSLPADVAAGVGTSARRGAAFGDLVRAGVIPENGDGIRAGDSVLQQLGPAAPLAPDGRLLTYQNTLAPGTPSASAATVVALASGESRMGVDVAIRFTPGVRVSGIVSAPGGAMGNVAVRLVPATGPDAISAYTTDFNPAGVATAVSAADGAFTFPAVAAGQYLLAVSSIDMDAASTAPSLWASEPVTVGDANVSGLALALQPGIHVRGRLEFLDATGPVVSASRPVVVVLGPPVAGVWRTRPARVTSGETFETGGDPPGRYFIRTTAASPPGWTLESVSRGGRRLDDDVIDLESDDVSDVVLTFSKTPTRVTATITNAAGTPDADAGVIVFPADTMMWREGILNERRIRRVPASSAGRVDISALPPGDYYVAAIGEALLDRWDDPSFLDRLAGEATKITLESGAEKPLALKTLELRGR